MWGWFFFFLVGFFFGFFFFFLVVMEAILEERITNCGISAAGRRRRGALPTQVEPRRDRTDDGEAGTSRECRRAPGAHPGSRGRGGTLPSPLGTELGTGAAPGARRGQRSARGQLPGPGHGGDRAQLGGSCWEQGSARGQLLGPGLGSGAAPGSRARLGGSSCRLRVAQHQPLLLLLFLLRLLLLLRPQPSEPRRRSRPALLPGRRRSRSDPAARKGCGDARADFGSDPAAGRGDGRKFPCSSHESLSCPGSCLAAVWVESLWHTTGMCLVSSSHHPSDISPNCWGVRVERYQLLFSVTMERKQ
ncbi:uncharacterized protein LOC143694628 isoform X3 [Agelaius phoeniceus]|uniref:uncharacterized protein LOC143694628 isoform X3 n=1 Tax=Agelaius phoeniceus TaxID=39638 RepID=UPI004054F328